jgi:hypothetical protein
MALCTTSSPLTPAHPNAAHTAQTCPECSRTTFPLGTHYWQICACEYAAAEQEGQTTLGDSDRVQRRGLWANWENGGVWRGKLELTAGTLNEGGLNGVSLTTDMTVESGLLFEDEEARRADDALSLKLENERIARQAVRTD